MLNKLSMYLSEVFILQNFHHWNVCDIFFSSLDFNRLKCVSILANPVEQVNTRISTDISVSECDMSVIVHLAPFTFIQLVIRYKHTYKKCAQIQQLINSFSFLLSLILVLHECVYVCTCIVYTCTMEIFHM